MTILPHALKGFLRAALLLLCSATIARSAITFADIQLWTGAAPGPGINEAAFVVDFSDGSPGVTWGYRWAAQEAKTGQDMLAAILGANPALSVDSTFFPNAFTYGARTRSFSDNGTPADYTDDSYWGYWVNNEVYYDPNNFLLNSHIVPPATEVVPLGNPYGPGHWVESSTGAAARPLVNGSWDGWVYGPYLTQPGNALAAVPEPSTAGILTLVFAAGLIPPEKKLGIMNPFHMQGIYRCLAAAASLLAAMTAGASGPYPAGPGAMGSDAIPADSALFTGWATGVASFTRGPQQAGGTSTPVNYGAPETVLGPANAAGATYEAGSTPPVFSLGDGGRITLTFATPVADGEGPDFAVFENGFYTTSTAVFAELAFVEVSSNGTDFVRFPAVSLTQTATQTGTFTTLDPTNLHNLAGKHPAGYGTPFDLAELAGTPGLDVSRITHIRLIDVVGDVKNNRGSRDSLDNWINDPWPTNFNTGGFDLDAVGVIHQAADIWQQWLASPDADPDGDGRTNLVEWAVDSSPGTADATPALQITPTGPGVTLSFHRAARAGLSLTLEQSANGTAWTTLTTDPAAGDVSVSVSGLSARALYRLRIARTP